MKIDAKEIGRIVRTFVQEQIAELKTSLESAYDQLVDTAKTALLDTVSQNFERLKEALEKSISDRIAEIKPAKGEDGTSVKLEDVEKLIKDYIDNRSSEWQLQFERRAHDDVQRAIDKMPTPKDGRDAFELDDMTVESDDDGNVTFKFSRDNIEKTFHIRLPRFKDAGVYREDAEYKSGDGVSCNGSFWIAQKDAPQGRPGNTEDWRLAVKKGRDARENPAKSEKKTPYKLYGADNG